MPSARLNGVAPVAAARRRMSRVMAPMRIDIRLCLGRLGVPLDVAATPLPSVTDDEIQILSVPVRRRRSGSKITGESR